MRSAFGARFDVPPGYLNTSSIGVPPEATADIVEQSVQRWRRGGDSAPSFDEPVAVARSAWARLVGVDPATVATGAGVSQLVSLAAAGVPDGTRAVTVEGEFTSATFPFAAQGHRGVTVTAVPSADLVDRAPEFDLVVVSLVQSADGTIADTEGLRAAGTPVLFDVTQATGWLPTDVSWAHWLVGSGYKWLLSPRGAAWMAINPAARDWTRPVAAGWYAGEDPWSTVYDLPLRLAGDARAFDLSPTWLAQVGAAESLPWIAGLDLAAVHAHNTGLADQVLTGLDLPEAGSAVITVDLPDAAPRLRAAGVHCAVRAGKARLGFHLYNTEDDVALVLAALRG